MKSYEIARWYMVLGAGIMFLVAALSEPAVTAGLMDTEVLSPVYWPLMAAGAICFFWGAWSYLNEKVVDKENE